MASYLNSTAIEVRYLLGELSEEEEKNFESRYFADDQAFEELQIAEGEVIDAYVTERLPAPARLHLEQQLAKSPRLRERVAFARTFAEAVPDIQLSEVPFAPAEARFSRSDEPAIRPDLSTLPRRRGWEGFTTLFGRQPVATMALAAGFALVLFGGAAVIVRSLRLGREAQWLAAERAAIEGQREDLQRLSAEQNTKIEQLTSELKSQKTGNAEALAQLEEMRQRLKQKEESKPQNILTPAMATVFLSVGSIRSEGRAEGVKIPPGISHLPLGLVLETADYRRYNVAIRDAQRKVVFSKNGLTLRSGKSLLLRVPTTLVPPGTYSVEVSGVAPSGPQHLRTYQFRVIAD